MGVPGAPRDLPASHRGASHGCAAALRCPAGGAAGRMACAAAVPQPGLNSEHLLPLRVVELSPGVSRNNSRTMRRKCAKRKDLRLGGGE